MRLIVKHKYISLLKKRNESDWADFELDIKKIGLFNKPVLNIKNLSIKANKIVDNMLICKTSDLLTINLYEQRELDKENGMNVHSEEYKELEKQRIALLKQYNKDNKYYDIIPVTKDKIVLATPSVDIVYYYIIYIE